MDYFTLAPLQNVNKRADYAVFSFEKLQENLPSFFALEGQRSAAPRDHQNSM